MVMLEDDGCLRSEDGGLALLRNRVRLGIVRAVDSLNLEPILCSIDVLNLNA